MDKSKAPPWPNWKVTTSEISLRDLFAAFCAAGLRANIDSGDESDSEGIAKRAFADADALLAQREATDDAD
jgi:hypothetical protein